MKTLFAIILFSLILSSIAQASVRLNWVDQSNNETQFVVWRWNKQGGNWWYVINYPIANSTIYIDKTVRKGRYYCYVVSARNNLGDSPDSNKVCLTAP